MHSGDDVRKIKCFEGLYFSFAILEFNYQGLHQACSTIITDNETIIPILSRCWTIIDQIHRIREIAQAIPGLSNRNEQLKQFLADTETIEDSRHYIQHLRKELLANPPHPFPVWGTISWIDHQDTTISHTALLGTQAVKTSYTSCVYDRFKKQWVSTVTLAVKDISINLDPICEAVIKFKDFIIPWIFQNYNSEIRTVVKLPIFSVSITSPS